MRFDSILIVTYGRSGSTLLQGVLNSIDGVLVRGENMNFAYHLFCAHRALVASKEEVRARGSERVESPWYGANELDPEGFLEVCRREIRRQIIGEGAEPGVYGFKEIRYLEVRADLHPYLAFLGRVFPNPCFVFNTRASDEVCRSAFWLYRDPEGLAAELADANRLFREAVDRDPARSFLIDYAETTANGSRVEELFAFLGAPYSREAVARVLERTHAGRTTVKDRSRAARIMRERAAAKAGGGAEREGPGRGPERP